jgi:hypothetical protein
MSSRAALPTRRESETFRFEHVGVRYYGTLSYAPDNGTEPIELFLQGGKTGSDLEAMCRDFAVAASLALQHGTHFETLRKSVTRLDDGSAAGPGGRFLDVIGNRT